MIKMLLGFILLWVAVAAGIQHWRRLNHRSRWSLARAVSFGALCAVITSAILFVIVALF